MAYIFHIIEKEQWSQHSDNKLEYTPESLNNDGFIHCAKADQLLEILNSMFKAKKFEHLILLKISESKILSEVKTEPPFEFPMSQVFYPHIYGALNKDAIEEIIDLPCQEDGSYKLPKIF